MAIADLVIIHRTRAGLSQQELAERMGTTLRTVNRLESGQHPLPSIKTLRRFAAALGGRLTIDIKYLPKNSA